ncbi:MAG: AI-2E family transporter [Limisphaerales bacterium]
MSLPPPTAKQARVIWFALTLAAVSLSLAVLGAILWGVGLALKALTPVLLPIAIAAVVAFILDPVVDWLEARRVPRWRAIALVFAFGFFVVVGALGSVVPRAVVQARDLAGRLPAYVELGRARVESWINHPPAPLARLLPEGFLNLLPHAAGDTNILTGAKPGAATNVTAHAAGALANSPPVAATNLVSLLPPATADSPWWHKALDPQSLQSAGGWLAAVVPDFLGWLLGQVGRVASWLGLLAGLALVPIYVFFFLLEKRGISEHWTDYLPVSDSRFKTELIWLVENINDALIVFFRGQVLVALCDGVLYTVGFLAIGLPYALLLGLMASVLTIIPFLGAIVTCGSALVIAFVAFGDWQHPALVLLVFAIVQGIEGWVIQPKIIGDRVGMHPLTIIIALMVGTTVLGGILGAILAIPVTAVLRAVLLRYVWRRPVPGTG